MKATPAIVGVGLMFCTLLCGRAHAHLGTPNVKAEQACVEHALGDGCEWLGPHGARYVGTCRQIAATLRCVRNRPIVYPEASEGGAGHQGAEHGHEHAETEAAELDSKVERRSPGAAKSRPMLRIAFALAGLFVLAALVWAHRKRSAPRP